MINHEIIKISTTWRWAQSNLSNSKGKNKMSAKVMKEKITLRISTTILKTVKLFWHHQRICSTR